MQSLTRGHVISSSACPPPFPAPRRRQVARFRSPTRSARTKWAALETCVQRWCYCSVPLFCGKSDGPMGRRTLINEVNHSNQPGDPCVTNRSRPTVTCLSRLALVTRILLTHFDLVIRISFPNHPLISLNQHHVMDGTILTIRGTLCRATTAQSLCHAWR